MHLGEQFWIHGTFLVFVAGAVYAQALTGFALNLILLGLIGATNLVPLTDAVNASTVIAFCSAWTFLYRRRALRVERPSSRRWLRARWASWSARSCSAGLPERPIRSFAFFSA
jgi:hypothetical protein